MIKKILKCFGAIVIIAVIVIATAAWQSYKFWIQQPTKDAESITIVVNEGASVSSIAADLKDQELISSKFWFKVFSKINGSARGLQAGEFELKAGMN